jgi:hypothetical protein
MSVIQNTGNIKVDKVDGVEFGFLAYIGDVPTYRAGTLFVVLKEERRVLTVFTPDGRVLRVSSFLFRQTPKQKKKKKKKKQ